MTNLQHSVTNINSTSSFLNTPSTRLLVSRISESDNHASSFPAIFWPQQGWKSCGIGKKL